MDSEQQARREAEQTAAGERLTKLAEAIGGHVSAKALFGEPVERDGVTVIPVARVRYGFGAGSGTGGKRRRGHKDDGAGEDQYGSGGGGGVQAAPIGYIELRNGQARFARITDSRRVLALLALPLAVLAAAVIVALGRGGRLQRD